MKITRFLAAAAATPCTYARPAVDDYAEKTKEIVAAWKGMQGKQGGDPAELADALVKLVALKEPPLRFAAGADAVETLEAKAKALLSQAQAHRELSTSLAHDNAERRQNPIDSVARGAKRSH